MRFGHFTFFAVLTLNRTDDRNIFWPLNLWSRYSRMILTTCTSVRMSAPNAREPTWYLTQHYIIHNRIWTTEMSGISSNSDMLLLWSTVRNFHQNDLIKTIIIICRFNSDREKWINMCKPWIIVLLYVNIIYSAQRKWVHPLWKVTF